MSKIKVGILGATGLVGQQYVKLLAHHPLFELTFVAASDHSAGKPYHEAIQEKKIFDLPDSIGNLLVSSIHQIEEASKRCTLIFSSIPQELAKIYETQYAKRGLGVISNASFHRLEPDIPLLIPEINPNHLNILTAQKKKRGYGSGFIVTKPNCSFQSYLIPLYPLHVKFGVKRLIVTTMQLNHP